MTATDNKLARSAACRARPTPARCWPCSDTATSVPAHHGLAGHARPAAAKVGLLPTFYFPDGAGSLQAVTNSTPIIRRLDASTPERSVRPANPVLALIDAILEDYGDEWLTKAMFHYRWHYADDIARSPPPCCRTGPQGPDVPTRP